MFVINNLLSMDLYQEHTELLKQAGAEFGLLDLASITSEDVLVLIDCQNDFFPENTVEDGGRFGVAVKFFNTDLLVGWREDCATCDPVDRSICIQEVYNCSNKGFPLEPSLFLPAKWRRLPSTLYSRIKGSRG